MELSDTALAYLMCQVSEELGVTVPLKDVAGLFSDVKFLVGIKLQVPELVDAALTEEDESDSDCEIIEIVFGSGDVNSCTSIGERDVRSKIKECDATITAGKAESSKCSQKSGSKTGKFHEGRKESVTDSDKESESDDAKGSVVDRGKESIADSGTNSDRKESTTEVDTASAKESCNSVGSSSSVAKNISSFKLKKVSVTLSDCLKDKTVLSQLKSSKNDSTGDDGRHSHDLLTEHVSAVCDIDKTAEGSGSDESSNVCAAEKTKYCRNYKKVSCKDVQYVTSKDVPNVASKDVPYVTKCVSDLNKMVEKRALRKVLAASPVQRLKPGSVVFLPGDLVPILLNNDDVDKLESSSVDKLESSSEMYDNRPFEERFPNTSCVDQKRDKSNAVSRHQNNSVDMEEITGDGSIDYTIEDYVPEKALAQIEECSSVMCENVTDIDIEKQPQTDKVGVEENAEESSTITLEQTANSINCQQSDMGVLNGVKKQGTCMLERGVDAECHHSDSKSCQQDGELRNIQIMPAISEAENSQSGSEVESSVESTSAVLNSAKEHDKDQIDSINDLRERTDAEESEYLKMRKGQIYCGIKAAVERVMVQAGRLKKSENTGAAFYHDDGTEEFLTQTSCDRMKRKILADMSSAVVSAVKETEGLGAKLKMRQRNGQIKLIKNGVVSVGKKILGKLRDTLYGSSSQCLFNFESFKKPGKSKSRTGKTFNDMVVLFKDTLKKEMEARKDHFKKMMETKRKADERFFNMGRKEEIKLKGINDTEQALSKMSANEKEKLRVQRIIDDEQKQSGNILTSTGEPMDVCCEEDKKGNEMQSEQQQQKMYTVDKANIQLPPGPGIEVVPTPLTQTTNKTPKPKRRVQNEHINLEVTKTQIDVLKDLVSECRKLIVDRSDTLKEILINRHYAGMNSELSKEQKLVEKSAVLSETKWNAFVSILYQLASQESENFLKQVKKVVAEMKSHFPGWKTMEIDFEKRPTVTTVVACLRIDIKKNLQQLDFELLLHYSRLEEVTDKGNFSDPSTKVYVKWLKDEITTQKQIFYDLFKRILDLKVIREKGIKFFSDMSVSGEASANQTSAATQMSKEIIAPVLMHLPYKEVMTQRINLRLAMANQIEEVEVVLNEKAGTRRIKRETSEQILRKVGCETIDAIINREKKLKEILLRKEILPYTELKAEERVLNQLDLQWRTLVYAFELFDSKGFVEESIEKMKDLDVDLMNRYNFLTDLLEDTPNECTVSNLFYASWLKEEIVHQKGSLYMIYNLMLELESHYARKEMPRVAISEPIYRITVKSADQAQSSTDKTVPVVIEADSSEREPPTKKFKIGNLLYEIKSIPGGSVRPGEDAEPQKGGVNSNNATANSAPQIEILQTPATAIEPTMKSSPEDIARPDGDTEPQNNATAHSAPQIVILQPGTCTMIPPKIPVGSSQVDLTVGSPKDNVARLTQPEETSFSTSACEQQQPQAKTARILTLKANQCVIDRMAHMLQSKIDAANKLTYGLNCPSTTAIEPKIPVSSSQVDLTVGSPNDNVARLTQPEETSFSTSACKQQQPQTETARILTLKAYQCAVDEMAHGLKSKIDAANRLAYGLNYASTTAQDTHTSSGFTTSVAKDSVNSSGGGVETVSEVKSVGPETHLLNKPQLLPPLIPMFPRTSVGIPSATTQFALVPVIPRPRVPLQSGSAAFSPPQTIMKTMPQASVHPQANSKAPAKSKCSQQLNNPITPPVLPTSVPVKHFILQTVPVSEQIGGVASGQPVVRLISVPEASVNSLQKDAMVTQQIMTQSQGESGNNSVTIKQEPEEIGSDGPQILNVFSMKDAGNEVGFESMADQSVTPSTSIDSVTCTKGQETAEIGGAISNSVAPSDFVTAPVTVLAGQSTQSAENKPIAFLAGKNTQSAEIKPNTVSDDQIINDISSPEDEEEEEQNENEKDTVSVKQKDELINKRYAVNKSKDGKKQFKCQTCSKVFNHRFSCIRHCKSHSVETGKKCEKCGSVFYSKNMFSRHYKSHFTIDQQAISGPDISTQVKIAEAKQNHDKKLHGCGACSLSCMSESHLKNHLRTHLKGQAYKCYLCNLSFTKGTTRDRHMQLHTIGEEGSPYQCYVCQNYFWFEYAVRNHFRLCHPAAKKSKIDLTLAKKHSAIAALSRDKDNDLDVNTATAGGNEMPDIQAMTKSMEMKKEKLKVRRIELLRELERRVNTKEESNTYPFLKGLLTRDTVEKAGSSKIVHTASKNAPMIRKDMVNDRDEEHMSDTEEVDLENSSNVDIENISATDSDVDMEKSSLSEDVDYTIEMNIDSDSDEQNDAVEKEESQVSAEQASGNNESGSSSNKTFTIVSDNSFVNSLSSLDEIMYKLKSIKKEEQPDILAEYVIGDNETKFQPVSKPVVQIPRKYSAAEVLKHPEQFPELTGASITLKDVVKSRIPKLPVSKTVSERREYRRQYMREYQRKAIMKKRLDNDPGLNHDDPRPVSKTVSERQEYRRQYRRQYQEMAGTKKRIDNYLSLIPDRDPRLIPDDLEPDVVPDNDPMLIPDDLEPDMVPDNDPMLIPDDLEPDVVPDNDPMLIPDEIGPGLVPDNPGTILDFVSTLGGDLKHRFDQYVTLYKQSDTLSGTDTGETLEVDRGVHGSSDVKDIALVNSAVEVDTEKN